MAKWHFRRLELPIFHLHVATSFRHAAAIGCGQSASHSPACIRGGDDGRIKERPTTSSSDLRTIPSIIGRARTRRSTAGARIGIPGILIGQKMRDDHAALRIEADMQFLPAATFLAMLGPTPFALAVNLQSRAVHDQVQRFRRIPNPRLDRQRLAPTAKRRRTGNRKVQTKQIEQALGEALGLAQSKMINRAQRQHRLDRTVRIDPLAASALALRRFPAINHIGGKPEGDRASLTKTGVVRPPIPHPVLCFRNMVTMGIMEFVRHEKAQALEQKGENHLPAHPSPTQPATISATTLFFIEF